MSESRSRFSFFFFCSSSSSSKLKINLRYDANISLPGCDKNMPGTIIAAARLDRPSLMVYGGTIKPGSSKSNELLDIVSAFQSYGEEELFIYLFIVVFSLLLLRHRHHHYQRRLV